MKLVLCVILLSLLANVSSADVTQEFLQGEWWAEGKIIVFDGDSVAFHKREREGVPPEHTTTFNLADSDDGSPVLKLLPAADHPAYTFILNRVSDDILGVTLPTKEPPRWKTTFGDPVSPNLAYVGTDTTWQRTPPSLPDEHFLGAWSDDRDGFAASDLILFSDGLAFGGTGIGPARWERLSPNSVLVSAWWPDDEEDHVARIALHATPSPEHLIGRSHERAGIWKREEDQGSEITREFVLRHMEQMRQVFADEPLIRALARGVPARTTVMIQDEDGKPLANVPVQVSYMLNTSQWISGHTDVEGRYTTEDRSRGEMRILVNTKNSGYEKIAPPDPIRFAREVSPDGTRWEPWGTVITTIVRRVVFDP